MFLSVITRYLTGEILKSSAATVLILFVVLMSNALGRVLSDIVDGEIPRQLLWPVLFSQSVNLFSLLLPVGFFLGIVFAFGRLYKDHEIVVMHACGMGYRHFYRAVFTALIPLLVVSGYTSLWLNAQMQRHAQQLVEREENVHEFDQIRAGQFNQGHADGLVFYMESISNDRLVLNNVIMSQNSETESLLETAQQGRNQIDEASGDLFLVVGPGKLHVGTPGEGDFTIIDFQRHGILLEKKIQQKKKTAGVKEKTLQQLWQSQNLRDRVELHWRISMPVTMIILSMLAVPLAYISPRQGRFGKISYTVLVYLLYFNLMAFGRAQIEDDVIPLVINFWWIHAIFIVLTVFLLIKRNRLPQ